MVSSDLFWGVTPIWFSKGPTGDADFIVIKPPTVCFNSGPVSEKPDEGLFFVDKDTEESPVTGMLNTQYLLVHTLHFVFIKMKFCSIRQMNVCWQDQGRTLSFTLFFTHLNGQFL